jgi:ribonuclease BN (tRNA processing enzyme)
MRLTVLGSSASFTAANDAGSGYLLNQSGTRLLLDCGNGVLPRLLAQCPLEELSAILITHFHPDHYLDLIPMRYGLRYGLEEIAPPRLLLPPGGAAFLAGVGAALRDAPEMFNDAFRIEEYDPDKSLRIGAFTVEFQRTTHDVPTWAVAVEGDGRFVYSSDTQESDELEVFARDADLLLCEATYPHIGDLPSKNHLTGLQAGRLAHRAGARQLVLTHFWPGIERSRFLTEARAGFAGPITLAEPGLMLEVNATVTAEPGALVGDD